jgi:hypothetical protein
MSAHGQPQHRATHGSGTWLEIVLSMMAVWQHLKAWHGQRCKRALTGSNPMQCLQRCSRELRSTLGMRAWLAPPLDPPLTGAPGNISLMLMTHQPLASSPVRALTGYNGIHVRHCAWCTDSCSV